MATFDQSEEGRPPDSPNNHRKHNRKSKNVNKIQDANKNCLYQRSSLRNTLPKLLCLRKSPSTVRCDNNNLENFNTLCVSSLVAQNNYLSASGSNSSLKCDNNDILNSEESLTKSRNRGSFHQNVEEAMNSLLWQPYEYQNNDEGHSENYISNGSAGDQPQPSPPSHGPVRARPPANRLSRAGAAADRAPRDYYEADMADADGTTTYRAVPANVCNIGDVPTIHCVGNSVSNVQVLPLSGAQSVATLVVPVNEQDGSSTNVRTFASVEAQTDDVAPQQRRRERRRHRERGGEAAADQPGLSVLPDLLDSHLPPPYANAVLPVMFPAAQAAQVPLVAAPQVHALRWTFPHAGFRRGRLGSQSSGSSPKSCCGLRAWKPGSLRWFIALIALVAVCCVLVGTALGAARPQGRDHLTVSLLMIGVGVVLVTVSGVAWRLTAHDASLCRVGGGAGAAGDEGGPAGGGVGRFAPRPPPAHGRPHHPYAAMMYPEFRYRPPPPSYQASMQEYRLRLLLLDRTAAASPPPTYRTHAATLFRAPACARRDAASEYSCPPSYRSRASSRRPPPPPPGRSPTPASDGGAVVVGILGGAPKLAELPAADEPMEGSKDGNLVTIVQTADRSPVIVTVSGGGGGGDPVGVGGNEMEILAHL